MRKAVVRWWRGLRASWEGMRRYQRGQSMVIVAFAFIGILALAGLAFDLGWVYVERVQVARAADAAALAGAAELPLEGAAHLRAQSYLLENGYDHTDEDNVRLVIDGAPVSGPPEDEAQTVIWIDTAYSRDTSLPPDQQATTADRIRVRVKQQVPMHFMQFIGFRNFPVEASAEAENISNIDTVIVYDKSGSMEYDTLCYGCWEPSDEQYPSGNIFPLPWAGHIEPPPDHCRESGCGDDEEDTYYYYNPTYEYNDCNYRRSVYGGYEYYTIIEAEEYSRMSVDYHSWGYTPYYTFWVVQRNAYNYYHGRSVGAQGRDARGAYISHHPYVPYTEQGGLGVTCTWDDLVNGEYCRRNLPAGGPFPAPRVEYDFYAPVGDHYYIWLRGQGGNEGGNQHIFWGLDGAVLGQERNFSTGAYYDGARSDRWSWRRLSKGENGSEGDGVWLGQGDHTLLLWAGGAGFDVDRIVITTDGGSSLPSSILYDMPPNNGRTDWACHECDPRFAGRPGGQTPPAGDYRPDCNVGGNPDQRYDAIYDDEQPIRTALEAARHFVAKLDPRFDQVGYVRYSSSAEIASELECLRRRGVDDCTPEVITNTVLYELDRTRAGGSTNIADGIRRGIQVLSTGSGHYGRPGAAHVMVLMTDGEANTHTNCDSRCDDEDLWPAGDADKDCVVWYAQQARNNAIVIYTISLGWSADRELMEYVAELTGGYHRWAPTSDELDKIFDELYERIFLRLID